jgi:hypothetical protein
MALVVVMEPLTNASLSSLSTSTCSLVLYIK